MLALSLWASTQSPPPSPPLFWGGAGSAPAFGRYAGYCPIQWTVSGGGVRGRRGRAEQRRRATSTADFEVDFDDDFVVQMSRLARPFCAVKKWVRLLPIQTRNGPGHFFSPRRCFVGRGGGGSPRCVFWFTPGRVLFFTLGTIFVHPIPGGMCVSLPGVFFHLIPGPRSMLHREEFL